MKNLKLFSILTLVATPLFTSCLDDNNTEEAVKLPYYAYILNEGNYGKNDGEITGFTSDCQTQSLLYAQANKKSLGDTPNDIIFAPNRCLYVAVSTSQYIVKLDLNGLELARYATETSPRSLAIVNGDLYATTYGGIVQRFDTATLTLQGSIQVGSYPEGIAAINNTIAVCNSGWGSDNTVSLIDAKTNNVSKTVTLPHMNPQDIVVFNNKFYCNTTEYDASWNSVSTIVEIDPSTGATKDITKGFYMCPYSNKLIIVDQAVNYYTAPYTVTNDFYLYENGEVFTTSDWEDFKRLWIYGINVDPSTNYLFVLTNNMEGASIVNSTLHIFYSETHEAYSTAGPNSCKVVFAQ